MSRAPFHTWRIIYENASVCFCPKMPRTNVHCLTPSPPKRPVDVKRGKSEYVDSPNLLIAKAKLCRCQALYVSQYFAKSTQTEWHVNKKEFPFYLGLTFLCWHRTSVTRWAISLCFYAIAWNFYLVHSKTISTEKPSSFYCFTYQVCVFFLLI